MAVILSNPFKITTERRRCITALLASTGNSTGPFAVVVNTSTEQPAFIICSLNLETDIVGPP